MYKKILIQVLLLIILFTIVFSTFFLYFNKKENLSIVCENLPPLFNQYGLIIVDPLVNSNLDIENANIYVNWLISDRGKELINNFRKKGQQLFYFNHH